MISAARSKCLGTQTVTRLTFMLLVADLANTKWCKKPETWLKPWHMGTHLRVLNESYPMNTNMTGFRWFSQKSLSLCALDENSLSIGRVKNIEVHGRSMGIAGSLVLWINACFSGYLFSSADSKQSCRIIYHLIRVISCNNDIYLSGRNKHFILISSLNCWQWVVDLQEML